ncbi:hypothetical protein Syun_022098 [Stephania yunnanensis]|uniref:GDP-D-glucose phosphorylase 1 n=1 Tax=Stephania yunnanensis TaxID=152371 RepID=A0AAP0NSV1_9MAGN
MLTIKRVPTVVSNYQEESSESTGCGRNCLGNCCLPNSSLPLYEFNQDRVSRDNRRRNRSGFSFLNNLLLEQWRERMNRGLFRYDVSACETKVLSGQCGFIAQLNEGRHLKKRPTEFRVDQVLQPFDPNKFNFTKVGQEEVLFRFQPSTRFNGKDVTTAETRIFEISNGEFGDLSTNVVAINVSPIEYGHVLLIPRVLDCFPQRIDNESLLLALHMAAEAASPFFRLGYNSLGAFATINHLHFQAYYLAKPFPVEKAPIRRITMSVNGVMISQLLDYPVRGLVFEGGNTLRDLADVVARCCIRLQSDNVPYNVLVSDCGNRIFVFPQCYAEKQALGEVKQELLDTQVNPAVWEISGHIVLKRKEDFEGASEDYARRLLAEVSLSEKRFEEVKACVFKACGLQEEYKDNVEDKELVFSPPTTPHYAEACVVLQ